MSTITNTVWLLGASDPEMERIEALLMQTKCHFVYATANGRRVHPGNAYRADHPVIPEGSTVYAVECGWEGETADVFHIDHHRPGDLGFGRPPAEFLPASSIGQVHATLARLANPEYEDAGEFILSGQVWSVRMRETDKIVGKFRLLSLLPLYEDALAAAADHCLGAAYRGECPGINPDVLMRWRAASRAKFQGRTMAEVLADVEAAGHMLAHASTLRLAPNVFAMDMRSSVPIRELPEAATRLGIPYVSGPLVGPDGRKKFTVSGFPITVRAFLDVWAPAEGLVDLYGDPERGFAGGYAP